MGWSKFFRRRRWDEERARELQTYLELETAENIDKGMPADEACATAQRKLGNSTLVREEIYRMNSFGFLETLWQDIRFGARMLRKSPGFTITAALTLALGIGANTAIFSMVDWLVFQKLPVHDPKALTFLTFTRTGPVRNDSQFSVPEYQQITEECGTQFDGMAAAAFGASSGGQTGPDGLTFQGKTLPVQTYFVTGNFFSVLGLQPALGHFFTTQDSITPGADPVVVLAWDYWQSRFHGNPEMLGKSVAINGHAVTIIGISPKGFVGPAPAVHMQAYLPLNMLVIDAGTPNDFLQKADTRPLNIFARLKPGVSAEQMSAVLNTVSLHVLARYPRPDETPIGMRANPLRPPGMVTSNGVNPLVRTAVLFFSLGILILVLACVNVANLLLVRSTSRRSEMAVRAALGAAQGRLVRQLLTESLLLSLLGCCAGIATGLFATRLLNSVRFPSAFPLAFDFRFNWLVFAGALSAALLSSLVAGIAPAMQSAKATINNVLRDTGRSLTSRRQRLRNAMVVIQVAGSLGLLIIAGLFTRSLQSAQHADLGFDPHQVSNLTVDANQIGYSQAKGEAFYKSLLESTRALPGVESASLAAILPMGDTSIGGEILVPGIQPAKGQPHPSALYNTVTPGYLQTMRIPLLRGRDFEERDTATAPRVAVINQSMADKYWPHQDPLGHEFSVPQDPSHPIQIIGVMRNIRLVDPYSPMEPTYFVPLAQHYFPTVTLQVRSANAEIVRQLLALIDSIAPAMPVYAGTMTESLNGVNGLFLFRLGATLTGVLGGLGLILAVVGVYGVMSYSVSQRTHEIGIRMALGAQRSQVLALVGRQGILVVIAGLAIGLLPAFAISQLIQDFLIGISPTDAMTYTAIPILLAMVAMAACFIPARRATQVDPMLALRNE
jgi:macrolide transport system ATP-binding/permease protein